MVQSNGNGTVTINKWIPIVLFLIAIVSSTVAVMDRVVFGVVYDQLRRTQAIVDKHDTQITDVRLMLADQKRLLQSISEDIKEIKNKKIGSP